jgi:hypothetical protein
MARFQKLWVFLCLLSDFYDFLLAVSTILTQQRKHNKRHDARGITDKRDNGGMHLVEQDAVPEIVNVSVTNTTWFKALIANRF